VYNQAVFYLFATSVMLIDIKQQYIDN
jgi:hypothetical protein